MAKSKGFSLDFDDFMEYARKVSNLGDDALHDAVDKAFTASKDYVNKEVDKAMDASHYHFNKGEGQSQGKSRESLHKVASKPVEWNGNVAIAKIGVDLKDAIEFQFIIHGTKNGMKQDKKLYNIVKVKGKTKKEVRRIQQEEFLKKLKEATND